MTATSLSRDKHIYQITTRARAREMERQGDGEMERQGARDKDTGSERQRARDKDKGGTHTHTHTHTHSLSLSLSSARPKRKVTQFTTTQNDTAQRHGNEARVAAAAADCPVHAAGDSNVRWGQRKMERRRAFVTMEKKKWEGAGGHGRAALFFFVSSSSSFLLFFPACSKLVLQSHPTHPRGLAASIPLLLQERKTSYGSQAMFTLTAWPFSLKLLWAPIGLSFILFYFLATQANQKPSTTARVCVCLGRRRGEAER